MNPKLMNRWMEKLSPKMKIATKIFIVGPIYCKKPSVESGSCLAHLEKKYRGDIVMSPASNNKKIVDLSCCT